jgi:hypothetical protein
MTRPRRRGVRFAALLTTICLAAPAAGQRQNRLPEPEIGQPGKDVIWVPTPPEMVEMMMDLAQVTPDDFVVDLGSGDGRNIVAAAKRGARALGVEYDENLVAFSRRNAAMAGMSERAQFVKADMFQYDFSKATVLALFLLPSNMLQLRAKFVALAPGTRIVSNTFQIADWTPDRSVDLSPCDAWCTAHLWIVPARVEGTWKLPGGELQLTQQFQVITGTLTAGTMSQPLSGRLQGEEIRFTAGTTEYVGRVKGDAIEGTSPAGTWTATRVK